MDIIYFSTDLSNVEISLVSCWLGGEGGWVRRGQERVGSRIYNRKAKAEIKNFKAIICCIFTVYHSAKNLYPAEFYYFHLTSTEAKRKFYMQENINLYSASVI